MTIAGGISIMDLQTVVFVDGNMYAAVRAISIDFKTSYIVSRTI
jgi:hypothetical protein